MSKKYTDRTASAISKKESRFRVARSIRATGDHHKMVHYLGGVSTETPFENFFNMDNHTFIRYEIDECPTPENYTDTFDKKPNQFGYFIKGNFFDYVDGVVSRFSSEKHYFWLDFCNMPTEELLCDINRFMCDNEQHIEEIYLTFFCNHRGKEYVTEVLSKYDSSLEGRAKSICATMKEKFSIDKYTFSVLDVYVNGNSPMAVIKLKKKMKTPKQNTTNRLICNSVNYAKMRDKGFNNNEIEAMWRMPKQAIAAFQAWNTMGGKTWKKEEQDLLPNMDVRQVCQNTLWHGQEAVDPVGRVFPPVDFDPLSI
jgi:hypothetical protein